MAGSVDLGRQLEKLVSSLISSGRYNSRSEVLREGLRLLQKREKRLAAQSRVGSWRLQRREGSNRLSRSLLVSRPSIARWRNLAREGRPFAKKSGIVFANDEAD